MLVCDGPVQCGYHGRLPSEYGLQKNRPENFCTVGCPLRFGNAVKNDVIPTAPSSEIFHLFVRLIHVDMIAIKSTVGAGPYYLVSFSREVSADFSSSISFC